MISFDKTSSFFCSSPVALVSPASPTLLDSHCQSVKGILGVRALQVDETSSSDVAGNEFGRCLYCSEQQSQISRHLSPESKLFAEDIPVRAMYARLDLCEQISIDKQPCEGNDICVRHFIVLHG